MHANCIVTASYWPRCKSQFRRQVARQNKAWDWNNLMPTPRKSAGLAVDMLDDILANSAALAGYRTPVPAAPAACASSALPLSATSASRKRRATLKAASISQLCKFHRPQRSTGGGSRKSGAMCTMQALKTFDRLRARHLPTLDLCDLPLVCGGWRAAHTFEMPQK